MSKKEKFYSFRNQEGKVLRMSGALTIEDLLRAGVKEIGLSKPGEPFKSPDEYRHFDTDENEERREEPKGA